MASGAQIGAEPNVVHAPHLGFGRGGLTFGGRRPLGSRTVGSTWIVCLGMAVASLLLATLPMSLLSHRDAIVVGAFALKSCILPAVQALPGAGLLCCAAMPGLAAICYLAGNRVGKDAVAPADTASARKPTMGGDRTSALLLAFGAVSAIVFAVARNDSSMVLWGSRDVFDPMRPLAAAVGAVIFTLIGYAAFVRSPQDVTLCFFPSLSVLCIAYALLRLHLLGLVGVQDGYGEWFFESYTEQYGHAYYFFVVIACVFSLRLPAMRVVGILEGVVSAALLVMELLGPGQELSFPFMLFLFVVLCILIVVTHDVYGQDQLDALKGSARTWEPNRGDSLRVAAETLARRYGLSEREQAVFALLIDGKNRKGIREDLGLAYGTVGSYIARIYDKLRIHSRQELFALVYCEMQPDNANPSNVHAPCSSLSTTTSKR